MKNIDGNSLQSNFFNILFWSEKHILILIIQDPFSFFFNLFLFDVAHLNVMDEA